MDFRDTIETVGKGVDAAGVAVMILGFGVALVLYLRDVRGADVYRDARRRIGRAILLGLEILVAGDIIRTVAVAPTFTSIGVLALIVLIRTFLSTTLEMEVSGQWPWRQRADPTAAPPA